MNSRDNDEVDSDTHRPPDWEITMVLDVANHWDLSAREAEQFLEEIDAFGPRDEWVRLTEAGRC